MQRSIDTNRIRRLAGALATLAALAAVAAPVAAADGITDASDRRETPVLSDALDRQLANGHESQGVPDALDRYVANAERIGTGHLAGYESFRTGSSFATAAPTTGGGLEVDWASFGFGAAGAAALALLAAAALTAARSHRRVLRP